MFQELSIFSIIITVAIAGGVWLSVPHPGGAQEHVPACSAGQHWQDTHQRVALLHRRGDVTRHQIRVTSGG